ncbi:class I SAM-dependent methyltransferase [Methermicoccus shengliensis]|uniref:Class I SAM-dependent methyltransferase n=1 Tax=Methermicoccus shengliensis TaxID=660064 RepID=A0A832RVU2_9EURY|nr:class I SAM-dependent methyltransferase [Methermicoccus shengliensis]KUK04690.1 MAG: rRNA (Adenine-N6)-methyltransferase, putative [Euryarchaeota archaeon 55_53]KUK30543.1 MAG: rRNA (Adenine-N6)-methyltransferase, putative [Methanosarcinales archeaon 56_1174]MDI3487450.1 hypothetical protein [Methanosarcinales archaeon]MDN5295221.1 hypothetical protein [Methanosarcinales archaeon]HIH69690.1 class I SAM-dependent methyltransferase [Methermicoccus shengliensis]
MPHIFDPANAHELESEHRKKFFPAEKVVEVIESIDELKKDVAFDIGAGTGYLTLPLSKTFKKVCAVEISHEMTAKLRERLAKMGVKNVEIIVSDKPPEVDFEIDLVLFSNVLHEMDDASGYIEWARRASYIVVAEWKKIETPRGPPLEERMGVEELKRMFSGFELIKLDESLPYHYIAVLRAELLT